MVEKTSFEAEFEAATDLIAQGVVSGLDVMKRSNGFQVFAFVTNAAEEIQVSTPDQRFQSVLEQASGNYKSIENHQPEVEVSYRLQGVLNVVTRIRLLDR